MADLPAIGLLHCVDQRSKFLQHVIDSLKPRGRCGIVLDEGVLFLPRLTGILRSSAPPLKTDICLVWLGCGLGPLA